jgi:excinuclease Cho
MGRGYSEHQGVSGVTSDESDEPKEVKESGNLARRRRKVHPEFDETSLYEYPTHLREAIEHLPSLPGVYTFHGEEGDLPLYIGKSINIRSRVLSHLRTPEEARLLRQTKRITCERTAGEIGALLLESKLIKQLHPLHNQRLRMSRQLFAWRLVDDKPDLVSAKDVDFSSESGLYGLYGSRHSALQQLRDLADLHRLCYGVLGIEKLAKGRACFRAQLHQCLGACCGRESQQEHQSRFIGALTDLSVVTWPFHGAIAILENQADRQDFHVVRNWCYLGTASNIDDAKRLDKVAASFDSDSYKILCRPIVQSGVEVVVL